MANDPPIVSTADAVRPIYAGVDVGGTNIKIGFVDDEGRTVLRESIRTEEERGPDDAVMRMANQIRSMVEDVDGLAWDDLAAVGLATPGTHDIPAGMLLTPFNLPTWWNYPIRNKLQEACGKPVTYVNDANAAAFGEYWVGCGRDYPSMVMITLGTGVGGGIIVEDLSVDGAHSHGSEIGHMLIDLSPEARLCPCGNRGHLEAYCSATSIVKRTEELLEKARPTSIRERLDSGDALTTLLLAQEADKGDAFSLEIIDEAAEFLGIGIVNVAHMIDPSIVVLGGAVNFGGGSSELGQRFLERAGEAYRRRTFETLAKKTRIDFAELGGHAGYIGAAGVGRVAHRAAAKAES